MHALNILRALYKDARLRDDVAPYTADGLKAAVLGFKSPLWAVSTDNNNVHVSTGFFKWQQMRENMLRQTWNVCIAGEAHMIQSSDWLNIYCALWRYVMPCLLLEQASFHVVRQMGCGYVNLIQVV